jgi:hypothetical protein
VRWKATIRNAVQAQWTEPPVRELVEVEITNFYIGEVPDIDNMIKPILDAMTGAVYFDDSQVVFVSSRKLPRAESMRIPGRSPAMRHALNRGIEFVHVSIRSVREVEGVSYEKTD